LTHDLPWYLRGASIFGLQPMELRRIIPSVAILDNFTEFVIQGSQLESATAITLNEVEISAWDVNANGTEFSFGTAIAEPGLYTLTVSQNTGPSEYLPAALLVTEALEINSIESDNPIGSDIVSDSGGSRITVYGTGLNGGIALYFFESNQGIFPNSGNKIDQLTFGDNYVEFTAPATMHGIQYQIVIQKFATSEEVFTEELITGSDDSKPRLQIVQDLTYTDSCRLTFDEPVSATGFTMTGLYHDYGLNDAVDISDQFELNTYGNIVELRLKTGNSLEHNRTYEIAINGIEDINGNAPIGVGITGNTYSQTFISEDTLAPISLDLKRQTDSMQVSEAMSLTCGRSYMFIPEAQDNMTLPEKISYKVRTSRDGGISFGSPGKISRSGFNFIAEPTDTFIAFILIATDEAGLYAQQSFGPIAVGSALVEISDLNTIPSLVEELTRADICFDITGDIDLISNAQMSVMDRTYPVELKGSGDLRQAVLSYLNPAIADITENIIEVTLVVHLINSEIVTKTGSYTLEADATPPEVSIVSPVNESRIPINEVTEILIRSFDRYGIKKVEAKVNDADWLELTDPDVFQYEPLNSDPITIYVKATDLNDLFSETAVTLYPYAASSDVPMLQIVNPPDGIQYHEGQKITIEVEMRNITDAQLYMDIGGIEDGSQVPVSITRSESDPERFLKAVNLPDIDENTVVVLRLTDGNSLTARRFINLLCDTGIVEEMELTVHPSVNILTGTQLWINTEKPGEMLDYSAESAVRIDDPEGTVADEISVGIGPYPVTISETGTNVYVEGILKDLSGNEKQYENRVNKTPYLPTEYADVYIPDDVSKVTGDMIVVPGYDNGASELFWTVNNIGGGYELRNKSGIIFSGTDGMLTNMQFTGSGIAVQENKGDKGICWFSDKIKAELQKNNLPAAGKRRICQSTFSSAVG